MGCRPPSKGVFMSQKNQSDLDNALGDVFDVIVKAIGCFLLMIFQTSLFGIKQITTIEKFFKLFIPIFLVSLIIALSNLHLDFLSWLSPKIFDREVLSRIYNWGLFNNFTTILSFLSCLSSKQPRNCWPYQVLPLSKQAGFCGP